mmetsp:Transcript_48433/g.136914  ORF Transcript_48433/g.136914 Transcript_48433/m.136914 type:complete len:201 (+) Transcript_48433:767-1369(+)
MGSATCLPQWNVPGTPTGSASQSGSCSRQPRVHPSGARRRLSCMRSRRSDRGGFSSSSSSVRSWRGSATTRRTSTRTRPPSAAAPARSAPSASSPCAGAPRSRSSTRTATPSARISYAQAARGATRHQLPRQAHGSSARSAGARRPRSNHCPGWRTTPQAGSTSSPRRPASWPGPRFSARSRRCCPWMPTSWGPSWTRAC